MLRILQTHRVGPTRRITRIGDRKTARWQQALWLQLFTAKTDQHHLAPKIGIQADVAQSADRNDGVGRVDGHATAIAVLQTHHVVHMRVQGQQLVLDAAHGLCHHTRHTLHGGGDGQNIARAHRAIGIAVTLKGVAGQWRLHRRRHGGHGQAL